MHMPSVSRTDSQTDSLTGLKTGSLTGLAKRASFSFTKLTTLVAAATVLSSVVTAPAHALTPYSAQYRFSIGSKVNGQATRQLTSTPSGQWHYQFNASVLGMASASESSDFQLSKGVVISQQHQRQFKVLLKSRKSSIAFQPASRTLALQSEKRQETLNYPESAQPLDELNLEIQLREDLKAGKLKDRYVLVNDKGFQNLIIVNEGKATVKTPAGSFETICLRRVHDDPTRITRFWFAPSLDYLPVQVRQDDDGMRYQLMLNRYQPTASASK